MVDEEETRCLLLDEQVSRGWEASHLLLVVALGGGGLEVAGNLVMGTIGFCAIVRKK